MPKASAHLPGPPGAADHADADARAIAELTADPAVGSFRPIRAPASGERLWLVEVRPGSVLEDVRRTDVVATPRHYRASQATAKLYALRALAPRLGEAATAAAATVEAVTSSTPAEPVWLTTNEVARRCGTSRDTLDKVLAKAPDNLPGAPGNNGTGARHARRWNAATVDDWWLAATAAARGVVPAKAARRTQRRKSVAPNGAGPITMADLEAADARKKRR